jgi:ribonuclease HI
MIVYMDGSSLYHQSKRSPTLGWGLVALNGDDHIEASGAKTDLARRHTNSHELLAFAETVRFLKRARFDFSDIDFYTDDEMIAYSGFTLHPGNYVSAKVVERFHEQLRFIVAEFYDESMYDDMLEALTKATFHKVKGHDGIIYNMRVDYLAKHAAYRASGQNKTHHEFDEWLEQGFMEYRKGDSYIWYPPFVEQAA